jgi:two-component system response regulator FixJ
MSDRKLVHIIDDEEAIRRSTSFMLKTSGYATESWATGVAFLKEAKHLAEGCILLDVRMPDMDGLAVQQALSDRGIRMPVIVLTGHGDVSVAVRAMKGGAVDFLEKPFERVSLLASIEAAFARLAASGDRLQRVSEAQVLLGALTPRERDVLEGLAQGLPNKSIAFDLGISPRTVEVHRANLMSKLDVRSLSDALRIAFAAGMGA